MGPLLSIDTKLWAQRGAVWELEGVEVMYHYYINYINQKYAVQDSSDISGGLEIPLDMISTGPLLSLDTKLGDQRGAV